MMQNSPFYLLRIFSGGTGATMFLMGLPLDSLDTPLCGAERERSGIGAGAERSRSGAGSEPERERSVKKIRWSVSGAGAGRSRSGSGAVSGGYRKRRDRAARGKSTFSHVLCGAPYFRIFKIILKNKDWPSQWPYNPNSLYFF